MIRRKCLKELGHVWVDELYNLSPFMSFIFAEAASPLHCFALPAMTWRGGKCDSVFFYFRTYSFLLQFLQMPNFEYNFQYGNCYKNKSF